MINCVETNFYGSGGSNLNETARSYKTLALETDTIEGLTFVWFNDGKGWTSARHNLEETFDVMQHIYSMLLQVLQKSPITLIQRPTSIKTARLM